MARGAEEKQIVLDKILEVFDGAFLYGKEIRVPVGDVQIKIALTCAKDNVAAGGDVAVPGETKEVQTEASAPDAKVTDEEKNKIASMLAAMEF